MKYYRFSWMWVAILFCALSFNACSDNNDNPSTPEVIETTDGFFTAEINKLIDANYPDVVANGYAKLIIPKTMYDENRFTFPTNATNDMKCMVDAGYKVYVNGGSVRDAILGKPSHDVDFSTNASIEQIIATVPKTWSFNAFRNIWVVKAYHDGDIETDIAPIFAIFPELAGKANVPMAKNPDSPYSDDLLEDTYSRDFTFNSLYYDYATGDVIDYHGGLHDLRDGLVNTVVDADLKVSTDPRCILRGLRFAAKYNFKVGDAFDKALKNPGSEDDPILREGDRIVVPRYDGTVKINGEVLYPNTVYFKDGKNADYYIDLAGGTTSTAKKSKTIIIYMNGMVARADRKHKPRPGCQIVVPTKRRGRAMGLTEWLSIGTSAASLGTMFATIANLLKN